MWMNLIAALTLSAAPLTPLHGKSADVSIDTSGFEQTAPAGSLGGTYERLGQFGRPNAAPDALIFSVLVDSPPADFDLAKLQTHVLGSYRKRYGAETPAVQPSRDGFIVEWVEARPEGKQWNLYFEALQGGRWLEVHFSSMGPKLEALPVLEAQAREIVRTLQFAPKK